MWTKNGSKTLPSVLKRISEVIPAEFVSNQLVVDDHSSDKTREIAKSYGWQVIFNEGTGISDGANTALKHVTSKFFISFEQDLFLARDWWQKIPKHLSKPDVAISSGIRFSSQSLGLRKIQEYSIERYQRTGKRVESFLSGKTIDNTIYKTKIIRKLGGFPKLSISAGVDNVLALQVHQKNYEWKVDFAVRSLHLRKGLKDELSHYYWYGKHFDELAPFISARGLNMWFMASRLLFSPIRGLQIALKKRAPQAAYIYPLIRIVGLKGIFDGRKEASSSSKK